MKNNKTEIISWFEANSREINKLMESYIDDHLSWKPWKCSENFFDQMLSVVPQRWLTEDDRGEANCEIINIISDNLLVAAEVTEDLGATYYDLNKI
jgi:hypothetical protein